MGGEADALHGYLSSQILDQLASPRTASSSSRPSVLDDVTAERAEALGQRDAAARLASLRARHLPGLLARRTATRCAATPRLREYLLERLERRGTDRGARGPRRARRAAARRGPRRGRRRGVPARRHARARARAPRSRSIAAASSTAWTTRWPSAGCRRSGPAAARRQPPGGRRDDARPRPRGLRALRAGGRPPAHGLRAPAPGAGVAPRRGHDGLELLAPGPLARRARGQLGGRGRQPRDRGGALHAEPRRPRARGRAADRPHAERQPARRARHARHVRARAPDALLADAHASGWTAAVTEPWRIGLLRATGHPEQALALYERTRDRRLGPRLAARDGRAGDPDRPRPRRRRARGAAARARADAQPAARWCS